MTTATVSHPTDRPNFCRVQIGEVTIWFSYETPVAVNGPSTNYRTVVRENLWGPTTGKHLAYISPDKNSRVASDVFEDVLAKAVTNA